MGSWGRSPIARAAALAGLLALVAGPVAAPAARAEDEPPPQVTQDIRFTADDGTELLVRLGGRGPLVDGHLPARPVIAELSPYGPGCCTEYAGPEYNYLQVHIRGTGLSDGTFDALGPRTQRDLAEVLGWACAQPWSNGRVGLWGFSASAIVVYNSLHQRLPCLGTAVLGAGTHELYRDLLYPGGIPNGVPALGVLALIGAPALSLLPDRLQRDPLSLLPVAGGFAQLALEYNLHPTLDGWWRERGMRGDANHVPMLMVNGFFDVESRGAFETFQELAGNGSHLYVVGAHDGVPAGTGGAGDVTRRWFDRFLRDVPNGVDDEPAVQLWMAHGDRARMLAGDLVTRRADAWPVPGTRWVPLYLSGAASGTARSLNDGTLALAPPATATHQAYVPIPSLASATDPHTTALLGIFNGSPELTTMDLPEALGLSYTTAPFARDVDLAGPASLELALTATVPESDLWVVVSDVWPDGTAHPMATGRLRSSFPDIDPARSRRDPEGNVVQPLNDVGAKRLIPPGTEHRYFVELWPIGNRFKQGHRLRLHVIGASMYHEPTATGPDLVRSGGPDGGSVLRLPVLPGSDLAAALSARAAAPSPAAPAGVADAPVPRGDSGQRLPATGGRVPGLAAAAALLAAVALAHAARPRRRTPTQPVVPSHAQRD